MTTKTFKVALSLDNPRIIQSGIDVRSFDKQSIKIAIELTKNSQTYQIPTGAQIKISLLKIARQEQKIILDVPFTSPEAIDWLVPDYLDGYQGEVRVGVYLIVGTENIDVGYFNITSKVSDIDKAAEEFTDSVMQGWDQIEADLAEIRAKITQVDTLASDATSKYNAFDTSITQANQTIDDILALQPQFQAVLDETTGKDVINAPEIILARGGATTLGERLDESDRDFNIAEKKVRLLQNDKTLTQGTIVTFIDDDASSDVMTRLYPIFTSKDVPCNLAVVSSAINTDRKIVPEASGSMTTADLKKVMAEGWELLGHSDQHNPNLLAYETEQALDNDIKTNIKFLENIGSFKKGFVYPQSAQNESVRRVVRYYFDFAFANIGFNDSDNKKIMEINRIAFGYSNSQNPSIVNGVPKADSLEYYKACIDYAKQTGSWIVFMLHCWDINFDGQMLSDLIDYIRESDINIVNASTGFEMFKLSGNQKTFLKGNSKKSTDPITSYPMGDSVVNLGNTEATSGGFPTGKAGTLVTYRNGIEYYYNRQEYWVYLTKNERYYRYATSETEWSDWVRSTEYLFRNDVILNTNGPNLFPDESVTVDRISQSYAVAKGFPTEQEATIKTESYTNGPGYNAWQTYMTTNGKHVYKRVKGSTTTWTSWSRVNTGALTTSERNSLPKTTGDCVYDIILNKPVWVNTVGNWVDATGTSV